MATLKIGSDVVRERESAEVLVQLPSVDSRPLPSPDLGADSTGEDGPTLAVWKVAGLTFGPAPATKMLTAIRRDEAAVDLTLGDDLRYWTVAARFALELLYRQRFLPALRPEDRTYVAIWQPLFAAVPNEDSGANSGPTDQQRLTTMIKAMPPVSRALAWNTTTASGHPRDLLGDYLGQAVDNLARQCLPLGSWRPSRQRTTAEEWLETLNNAPTAPSTGEPTIAADVRQLAAFHQQHGTWTGAATATPGSDTFRVCFRLDPPDTAKKATANQGWTLHYMLQATDDPSLLVPATNVWRQRGSSARFVDRKFDHPQEHFLAGLGHASRLFPPIESSLRTARPERCALTTTEAYDFVREKALLLRSSGYGVLVPGLESNLGVRVRLKRRQEKATGQGLLTWDSIINYDWQVALGGETLSRAEFEQLASLKEPLVQVRGRWVELRPDQVEQALALFEKQNDGRMSLPEAIRLSLAPDSDHGLPVVEVITEGWLDDLVNQLREGQRPEPIDEPPGFAGELRTYQKVGVAWLASLRRHGLGACLADDMGLGKTVEIIATLLNERADQPEQAQGPVLLVCPTSVVGNWRRELARFAPSLRVLVHHGADRHREEFAQEATRHDVVLSTYALLHRDEAELCSVEWSDVILDEAQNIKNATTKASQAARKLNAGWRAALTGTPVENRLSDLWSIFQFINPGYLGSNAEFNRRFAEPIERAHDGATTARLKALVAPFILRRVKSDRTIINDLPDKNEMKVYCSLTKEQATLYEAIVNESLRQIAEAEGTQRRGLVLGTLTKLKQVCNHPALFLHDASRLDGRSGKLARLEEMLDEIITVGDHALLFSQYSEMGQLLKEHLATRFGREVLFLHGGTPAAERDRMVARFQSEGRGPNLFVLSIKAGGTGLNLTRANHVFHFDRWWNPAVENQATDRAFRIGQTRDVQVHKFICAGTFEESIDQLIERKVELSDQIVNQGETWITEMNTEQLRDLFQLRRDDVEDDE